MKFKKIMLQLGLLLAIAVGIGVVSEQTAKAATVPVDPFLAKKVTAQVTNLGSKPNLQNGWTTTLATRPDSAISLAANNVSTAGRITTSTTKIYLAISGSFSVNSWGSANITSLIPVAVDNDGHVIGQGTDLVKTSTKSVTMSGNYYEIDGDYSNLRDDLPLWIGFKVKTTDNVAGVYSYAKINSDASFFPSMMDYNNPDLLKITSTYDKKVLTGSVYFIKSSDSVISGTGMPGMAVKMIINETDGSTQTYNDTINTDGKYSFDLGGKIDDVLGPKASGVSVYQTNDMGDFQQAGADIVKILTLHAASPTLSLYPDGLDDNIKGKSDAEVLAWLTKEAGITVTQGTQSIANSDITFSAEETDLATKLAALQNGESMTIDVNGLLTSTASVKTPTETEDALPITVTKSDGQLKFGTMSGLNFGSVPVPSKETLIAPVDQPNIQIDDSQAANTNWYVTAKASDFTSQDGANRTLNGHLVYVDADGNQEPMSSIVQVASGKRDRSTTYPQNIAAGWATAKSDTSKTPEGIYLDAMPNVYSGSASTAYQGTVTWYLGNVPNMSGTTTDDSSDSSIVNNAGASSESGSTGTIVNSGF